MVLEKKKILRFIIDRATVSNNSRYRYGLENICILKFFFFYKSFMPFSCLLSSILPFLPSIVFRKKKRLSLLTPICLIQRWIISNEMENEKWKIHEKMHDFNQYFIRLLNEFYFFYIYLNFFYFLYLFEYFCIKFSIISIFNHKIIFPLFYNYSFRILSVFKSVFNIQFRDSYA